MRPSLRRQLEQAWRRARAGSPRLLALGALVFGVVVVTGLWFVWSVQRGLPDKEAIGRIGDMAQSTTVLDRDDRIAFTLYKEQRIDVPLEQISPSLVEAFLAIEDQRFYEHSGFDAIRIVSAAAVNVRHGRRAQGGSTITQQLARLSFLTHEKTFRRKVQEVILARRIERQYSKTRILEMYLNKVYFGAGLYGVEAASRGYFGKHASEATTAEAALLAGLMKSPSTYAPTVDMKRAVARRNVVLQVMRDAGAIDDAAWRAAREAPVSLKDGLRSDEPHGRYFKEQVRRELVERFGVERVYEGGLKVYSTIDLEMQEAAEHAVDAAIQSMDKRLQAAALRKAGAKGTVPPSPAEPLQAALIALDPRTGHVRAMVGGRDFDDSSFNRAVQARRQPGSAFKPFVYAAALEAGFTPATMIERLNEPIPTLEGAWTPEDGHSTADSLSLRTALRTSSNRAAVRLLQEVGIPQTVQYAKKMGVGDVPSVPSLALGSGEVTLQSLTAAYAAFANGGEVPAPLTIRRVEDRDGLVLWESQSSLTRAVKPVTAYLMATMMADVINAGTGARARSAGFTLPAGGKTGTTNDFKDAWFVGFTPNLVAGVWLGFDQPKTILANGFAGDLAVPMWAGFMKGATRGDKAEWVRQPSGISVARVCRLSGKLANDGCDDVEVLSDAGALQHRSMVYAEFFAAGTQPVDVCALHQKRGFLGQIAAAITGKPTHNASPPRLSEIGLPAPTTVQQPDGAVVVAATAPAPEAAPTEEPKKKKRGFWSKVFGINRDSKPADSVED